MLFPQTSKSQGLIPHLSWSGEELNNYYLLTGWLIWEQFNKGSLGRFLYRSPQAPQMPSFHCPLHWFPRYFCAKLICTSLYLQRSQVYAFAFLTLPSLDGVPPCPCQMLQLSNLSWCTVRRRSSQVVCSQQKQTFTVFTLDRSACLFLETSERTYLGISVSPASYLQYTAISCWR